MKKIGLLLFLVFCSISAFAEEGIRQKWLTTPNELMQKMEEEKTIKSIRTQNELEKELMWGSSYLITEEDRTVYYCYDHDSNQQLCLIGYFYYLPNKELNKELKKLGTPTEIYESELTIATLEQIIDFIKLNNKEPTEDNITTFVAAQSSAFTIRNLTEEAKNWRKITKKQKKSNKMNVSIFYTKEATIAVFENIVEGYSAIIYQWPKISK